VLLASRARCQEVDDLWPPKRPFAHANLGWKWAEVHKRSAECFALVRATDRRTLALWASLNRSLLLPEGRFYRLDYVEVEPGLRGGDIAGLTFSIAFQRALEVGVDGLVLPSFPETAHLYEQMGFERRVPTGWSVGKGMVAFVGKRELLLGLVEEASRYVVASDQAE